MLYIQQAPYTAPGLRQRNQWVWCKIRQWCFGVGVPRQEWVQVLWPSQSRNGSQRRCPGEGKARCGPWNVSGCKPGKDGFRKTQEVAVRGRAFLEEEAAQRNARRWGEGATGPKSSSVWLEHRIWGREGWYMSPECEGLVIKEHIKNLGLYPGNVQL